MRRSGRRATAFSLVELVVVVIIVSILASVAIPRFSRGVRGGAGAALAADLVHLRDAIFRYACEHRGVYPGPDGDGFAKCLTSCSSATGATKPARDQQHPFGPYLAQVPPCPVGENAGSSAVTISNTSPPTPAPATKAGWVYNPATGEIRPNTNRIDDTGSPYKVVGESSGNLGTPSGELDAAATAGNRGTDPK